MTPDLRLLSGFARGVLLSLHVVRGSYLFFFGSPRITDCEFRFRFKFFLFEEGLRVLGLRTDSCRMGFYKLDPCNRKNTRLIQHVRV